MERAAPAPRSGRSGGRSKPVKPKSAAPAAPAPNLAPNGGPRKPGKIRAEELVP